MQAVIVVVQIGAADIVRLGIFDERQTLETLNSLYRSQASTEGNMLETAHHPIAAYFPAADGLVGALFFRSRRRGLELHQQGIGAETERWIA